MLNKEFIPYELALELRELGFDEPCFGRYYYKESYPMLNPQSEETELVFEFGQYIKQTEVTILAPTFSHIFRWFREKYDLWSEIHVEDNVRFGEQKYYWNIFGKYISYEGNNWIRAIVDSNGVMSNTYEEAELACLRKLIEIVKEK